MVMLKRIAAPLALVVALACAGPVLAADPTVDQVYQAARAGHLDEAQQLMDQVLKDHPNSAKAHYVEAELSAKAGNLARGRTELATAQRLDPSGAFAKPEALAALQRELAGRGAMRGPTGYYPAAPRPVERSSSFPWPIILLVVAGVVIAWALLARRRPPQYPQYPGSVPPPGGVPGGGYGGPGPAGYGPGGYGPPGGGLGSCITSPTVTETVSRLLPATCLRRRMRTATWAEMTSASPMAAVPGMITVAAATAGGGGVATTGPEVLR